MSVAWIRNHLSFWQAVRWSSRAILLLSCIFHRLNNNWFKFHSNECIGSYSDEFENLFLFIFPYNGIEHFAQLAFFTFYGCANVHWKLNMLTFIAHHMINSATDVQFNHEFITSLHDSNQIKDQWYRNGQENSMKSDFPSIRDKYSHFIRFHFINCEL